MHSVPRNIRSEEQLIQRNLAVDRCCWAFCWSRVQILGAVPPPSPKQTCYRRRLANSSCLMALLHCARAQALPQPPSAAPRATPSRRPPTSRSLSGGSRGPTPPARTCSHQGAKHSNWSYSKLICTLWRTRFTKCHHSKELVLVTE